MTSRHIPKHISKAVQDKHFFECAWCGVKLTERHHITEFAKGGVHSIENLILLCPNCHTQVHRNEIRTDELIIRKSTHTKGDRLNGGIQFELKQPFVRMGSLTFRNTPTLLQFEDEALITLKEVNNEFFLSTRFYNIAGELVFWMSSNRYWTPIDFTVTSNRHQLLIVSNKDKNNTLKIWQDGESLVVEGKNYMKGHLIEIGQNHIHYRTHDIYATLIENFPIGLHFE